MIMNFFFKGFDFINLRDGNRYPGIELGGVKTQRL
jgi:hypothetical protein